MAMSKTGGASKAKAAPKKKAAPKAAAKKAEPKKSKPAAKTTKKAAPKATAKKAPPKKAAGPKLTPPQMSLLEAIAKVTQPAGLCRREEARPESRRHAAAAQAGQEGEEGREDQELLRLDLAGRQEIPRFHQVGPGRQGLSDPTLALCPRPAMTVG